MYTDDALDGLEVKEEYPEEILLSIIEEVVMQTYQDNKVSLMLIEEEGTTSYLREIEWCKNAIIYHHNKKEDIQTKASIEHQLTDTLRWKT